MSNTALISFKIGPEHYAVLKAMAASQNVSLSQFVRPPRFATGLPLVARRW